MYRKKTDLSIYHRATGRKGLFEAVKTPAFHKIKESGGVILPLGITRDGEMEILDLRTNHHLLIAGSVMSGKTEFLNCIITSVALSCQPEEAQLVLIDTTRVEFLSFNGLPHLIRPVVITMEESIKVLNWLVGEAVSRSRMLEAAGVADIQAYNRRRDKNMRLRHLFVVIYELSDLMYGFHDETEALLRKIAQARLDTGIHLVIATQRPEPAVISSTLKGAFPASICFSVNEAVDSVTVIGVAGAEKLNEAGEMLYSISGENHTKRLRGFSISESEIEQLVSSFISTENT
jgi:DNA segregation ATPase FtsK/SpoIIIE, S-DNA-T family